MSKTKTAAKKSTAQPVKLRANEIAFWDRIISKVKDPEEPQDVATKKYVDDNAGSGGTTYTAGTGIDITGSTISADTTVLATKSDLSAKQDTLTAGDNITISDNTISATNTTYSDFTGTDGVDAGTAGLVPAPATTDAGKYLKSDGTWETITIPQSGIPATAKFFNQTYDSVNNRVASNTLNIGVPGDKSSLRELVFSPTGGSSVSTAYIRGYSNGMLSLTAGGGQRMSFSASNYSRMMLDSTSLTGQHPNGDVFRIKDITDPVDAQDVATKNYVDSFYPVGTVYSSTSSTAPTFAGGTWSQIGTQTIGSSTVYYYERTA